MAYNFVIREDKMDQLQSDLANAATSVSNYIADIYKKIADLNTDWDGDVYQSFVKKSETYRAPLENLSSILTQFSQLVGEFGSDGNVLITEVMKLLSVDQKDVSSATAGVRGVVTDRPRDSRGAYIPTEGNYGERIEIPTNTTLAKGQDCSVIGDALYDDTKKTQKILQSEIEYITSYKTAHMSEIMALPTAQREATLNYLNSQIVQRQSIVDKIENATVSGYWVSDGAIFNATSQDHTGNVVLGLGISDQEAVDAAVNAAKAINSALSVLSSIGSIDAYMNDCDI